MTKHDKIIEILQRRNPSDTNLNVSRTIPNFLEGDLVVVEIINNGNRVSENYYYDHIDSTESRSFTSMDEFALWIGQKQPKKIIKEKTPISSILTFEFVSAFIAILITITICSIFAYGLLVKDKVIDIPGIFSNALTVILGFYFGSQVTKKSQPNLGDKEMVKIVEK